MNESEGNLFIPYHGNSLLGMVEAEVTPVETETFAVSVRGQVWLGAEPMPFRLAAHNYCLEHIGVALVFGGRNWDDMFHSITLLQRRGKH